MHIIESQNSLELERKHQQAELIVNIDPKFSSLSTLDLHVSPLGNMVFLVPRSVKQTPIFTKQTPNWKLKLHLL